MKISMTRENYGAQFGAFTLLDDSCAEFCRENSELFHVVAEESNLRFAVVDDRT
jgi:hypothetical protein